MSYADMAKTKGNDAKESVDDGKHEANAAAHDAEVSFEIVSLFLRCGVFLFLFVLWAEVVLFFCRIVLSSVMNIVVMIISC